MGEQREQEGLPLASGSSFVAKAGQTGVRNNPSKYST